MTLLLLRSLSINTFVILIFNCQADPPLSRAYLKDFISFYATVSPAEIHMLMQLKKWH